MGNDSSYGQVIRLPDCETSTSQEEDVLALQSSLTDVFSTAPADPTATGFVLSLMAKNNGPILWVQGYTSRRENGRLYTPGLKALGVEQAVLHVNVGHPRDVLWAMEEGAACASLSAVVGEIHGGPAMLDFTATRRLAMRAEQSGVPLYLIRSGDPGGLSAARMRWRVGALPSLEHPHDTASPGLAQWDVELFRARGPRPDRWVAQYDPNATRTADRIRLVSKSVDGTVETRGQPASNLARR